MRASERVLATLIAATLVAGVVGLLTKDTSPDVAVGPTPTPSETQGSTPSPTETAEPTSTPSGEPTTAGSPTPSEEPTPEPTQTEEPGPPDLPDTGVGTSWFGAALLAAAGWVWLQRRRAY